MFLTSFLKPVYTKHTTSFNEEQSIEYWKKRLHGAYIDNLEDNVFGQHITTSDLNSKLSVLLTNLLHQQNESLSLGTGKQVIRHVETEVAGYGPIDSLMNDVQVTDILINGADDIWYEANGQLIKTALKFDDNDHLYRFLDRLISHQGKFLDAKNPIVDARLSDGSRINAVIPPLSRVGPVVSIRRFHKRKLTAQHLIDSGFLNKNIWDIITAAVSARLNIIICGGAGVGKTSLLNIVASAIPQGQRIVTVEESAELDLSHDHVVSLEERAANSDAKGNVTVRDLVRAALRMRADRIIVGESRGGEVLDMLQAMSCGHEGSLTTLHANSAQDVVSRMETLAQMHEKPLQSQTVSQLIHSSIDLVVHLKKTPNGKRLVSNVGMLTDDNGKATVVDVITLMRRPQDKNGYEYKVSTRIDCLLDRIAHKGIDTAPLRAQLTKRGE